MVYMETLQQSMIYMESVDSKDIYMVMSCTNMSILSINGCNYK